MHCNRYVPRPISRRQMLRTCANGFGSVALTALTYGRAAWLDRRPRQPPTTLRAARQTRRIPVYGRRTVSGRHVRLQAFAGKAQRRRPSPGDGQAGTNAVQQHWKGNAVTVGNSAGPASPGKLGQRKLFPHISKHIDDLAFIKSMTSNFSEHTSANYFLHTGNGFSRKTQHGFPGSAMVWVRRTKTSPDLSS